MSERDQIADKPLRMRAYYFGFSSTGRHEIDRVLSAVAQAGKGYHHTEYWADECEWLDGGSYVDLIQNEAQSAADLIESLFTYLRQIQALTDRRELTEDAAHSICIAVHNLTCDALEGKPAVGEGS